ncbi:MAG TPA: efflux RND transporter periplasmic adaptor subunit [Candidatus Acidoferrales bacterium]|nr:efflux RND transporter periplasmic adaptor subunit [Candidatus Acidoferrales bacterium]
MKHEPQLPALLEPYRELSGCLVPRRSLLLASLLLFLCGCGSSSPKADDAANAPQVAVVKVIRSDIASQLEIASEFLPYQEIDVFAKVSGYIQKLNVDWGSHVRQGQVLAVLEIPELEQQLLQDDASVKRSEHDSDRARQDLTQAEAAYSVAHVTYERLADVQKTQPGLVAQEEIDQAQGKDQEGSAGVSAAREGVSAAEQALAAAKAALDKDKALFAYARITAPFDGVVTRIDAYTGALLPAGTSSNKGDLALCHLSDNTLLRLVIPVPERAVPDIRAGETVDVEVSGLQKNFKGQIVRISDQIDTTTRTMHTEVSVPNPKNELIPGMYASVKIPLHSIEKALTVPIQAVETHNNVDGTVVLVNSANHAERRRIKLGLESATDYEVTAGLAENDRVVFGERSQLTEGELVNPKLIEAPAPPQE